jgi:hypothetical protein
MSARKLNGPFPHQRTNYRTNPYNQLVFIQNLCDCKGTAFFADMQVDILYFIL